MKLTKRQLKKIIKEELGRVMEGSDEAIEAFNDLVIDRSLSRNTDEANLVTFSHMRPEHIKSLPTIAAHYELYPEDIMMFAEKDKLANVPAIEGALKGYEDPAPEGDPLGDLPYEDPADRPDPFADLMQ